MEHVYPTVVDLIVQHFNHIAFGVKAKQTVFVFKTFNKFIEFNRIERPTNIGFSNTVPESRLLENNIKIVVHIYKIT